MILYCMICHARLEELGVGGYGGGEIGVINFRDHFDGRPPISSPVDAKFSNTKKCQ